MKGFILLSGEDVELALGELEGVLRSIGSNISIEEVDGRSVILSDPVPPGTAERMGLCHFAGRMIHSSVRDDKAIHEIVERTLDDTEKDLSISVKVASPEGKDGLSPNTLFNDFCGLASGMGFRLHHRDPGQRMFLILGEKARVGMIDERANRLSIVERRGSKMPFNRPIVMEPKLARAMVNLSGLEKGSTILDPFLGPAGLAIEAGHMGFDVIGVERDPEIFTGALMNIEAQDLRSRINVHNDDSRKINESDWWDGVDEINGIITDPPFGRSAPLMGEDPSILLQDVISVISPKMRKGSPLIMDTDNEDNFHLIPDFGIRKIYPFRVHKSLTRFIGVLERI